MRAVQRSLVVLSLLSLLVPEPAGATFHFMSISELGAGFFGDPDVQFVELRLDGDGQTNLTDTRLTSFDKDGNATELLLTTSGVQNGAAGRHVLYATAAFQSATGVMPDFVMPAGIVAPSGMICWGAPGTSPPDPSSWDFDKPENYVDCVAYGAYAHSTRPASGIPTALGPGDGVRALTRTKNNSVTGSNDTDFALAAAAPCNNAGQCAALAPTPTPTAAPGKAQLKCRRTIAKATTKLATARVQALVACETLRLKGKLAAPCPDGKAATKLAAADAKLGKTIAKGCGALGVAATGFGSACPGLTGGCAAPIASVGDVATCVGCLAARSGDELRALVYAAAPDAARLKCQLALGKSTTGFFRAAAALFARCEDAVAQGKLAAPCPDPKTATKIAAKAAKLASSLCKACGGADKQCDGTADPPPGTLGVTSCPARVVPGGDDCGLITIDGLDDVVACATCIATFESRCATAVSAGPSAAPLGCVLP